MRLLILLAFIFFSYTTIAQQKLNIRILDGEKKGLPSATINIAGIERCCTSDMYGFTQVNFSQNGNYSLKISAVGYSKKELILHIPHTSDTLVIEMEYSEEELDEVIVQSTRTSRTIANVPTRIETIDFEEIDEKTNMRPANVAMILHESTGIQVQQTSATSANASIRLQGLDGRYTQLLKDGFANFGNFSSGLSVLEIPPLDLKQVEIIKGPASTLYGGGAIAGVVNFISRVPKSEANYDFIINQSNIGQTNIGGFAAQRGKKTGYTILALYNRSKAYDVDNDDFTEVPKSNELTLHPKLFIYPDRKTTITVGNSFTEGERTGGDIYVIKNGTDAAHQYIEKNKTLRNISTFEFDKKINWGKRLLVKQSFGVFDRSIEIPNYHFAGVEHNGYTDLSYIINRYRHSFVLGGNFIYNDFNEKEKSADNRDNTSITGGLYGQHTWDASDKIKLESGLRFDAVKYKNANYKIAQAFILPRVSVLVKINSKWSSRIGVGMGYKAPTMFTEETETMQYRNVAQLNGVASEKSYGGTADVNFRTNLGDDFTFSFNHMFFYTWIRTPIVLKEGAGTKYFFYNETEPVHSAGFESNAKLIFRDHLKLFLGYTYTDSKADYLYVLPYLPLVPKHKLNTALIYEKEDVIKIGLEGYFTGKQVLSDGTVTSPFSEFGFMAEKIFKKFSLFVNFENFTDTRQSKYKSVVNGSHLDPTFDEIWTHTEGFVFNGGIKVRI